MAQVSKFELADVKAFVADYAEKRGKNPSRTVVLEHFGGGNKERASELMKAAIAEIEAEKVEAAKVSEMPDSVKAILAKLGNAIWLEAAKSSGLVAKTLEAALSEVTQSMDTLKRKTTQELDTLRADLEAERKAKEVMEKQYREAANWAEKATQEIKKLEVRVEVQGEVLDKKDTENKALNAEIARLTAALAVAEAKAK